METSFENETIENQIVVGRSGQVLIEAALERKARRAKIRLAEKIHNAIDQKGLTKVEFANLLGVSKQAVSKYLQGNSNFTIAQLIKFEQVLSIDLISSALEPKMSSLEDYSHSII